jgi:hypothetical protein
MSELDFDLGLGPDLEPVLGLTSTEADRDAQLNAEFRPLTCQECGTVVRVRKRSPDQTSVQWQSDATATCPYLVRPTPTAPLIAQCPALAATIRAAVRAGLIPSGSPSGPQ